MNNVINIYHDRKRGSKSAFKKSLLLLSSITTILNFYIHIYNDNPDKSEISYKFLGIYLDEYLSYDTHCNTICMYSKKLAMSNCMLNRAKDFLTLHTLRTLYLSLIHPHLLCIWPTYLQLHFSKEYL